MFLHSKFYPVASIATLSLVLRLTAYYAQQWGLCETRAGILKVVDDKDNMEDNGHSMGHNEQ